MLCLLYVLAFSVDLTIISTTVSFLIQWMMDGWMNERFYLH